MRQRNPGYLRKGKSTGVEFRNRCDVLKLDGKLWGVAAPPLSKKKNKNSMSQYTNLEFLL